MKTSPPVEASLKQRILELNSRLRMAIDPKLSQAINEQMSQLLWAAAADPLYLDELFSWEVSLRGRWLIRVRIECYERVVADDAELFGLLGELAGPLPELVYYRIADWLGQSICPQRSGTGWAFRLRVREHDSRRLAALAYRDFSEEIRTGAMQVLRRALPRPFFAEM